MCFKINLWGAQSVESFFLEATIFFFKICIDYYFSHFYERRNKNLILESSVMFKTMYKLFGGSCKSYKKIEGLFNEAIFPLQRA